MSHFTVLVISPTKLDQETLRPILQKWHEYECTGVDDQYVIDVDMTDEVAAEFNSAHKVVILADGTVLDRYDGQFWKRDDGGQQQFVLPEGGAEKEVTGDEARKHGIGYKTMAECAEDYFGAEERDGKFWRKTNPNAKWDWWTVGGRWAGMFAVNYDPEKDPDNQETCYLCGGTGKREWEGELIKCNACDGTGIRAKFPSKWKNVGNVAQLKDIPLVALRNEAEIAALKQYDKGVEVIAGRPFKTWSEIRADRLPVTDEMRTAYNTQPVIVDLSKAEVLNIFSGDEDLNRFRMRREDVAVRARRRAIQTFAVVKDGKWYQRGEMGWFACVSDEKDPDQWDREFADLIDNLPLETWLAVVDCHI